MKPNIGLRDGDSAAVVEILNRLLADEYVLYTKTRNYHWNVVGPQFNDLHKFFEAQYEAVDGIVDEVAERARSLGGRAWGTLAVQNTWEAGVSKEEEQGKRFATIAREANVQHFVYQSVGSADRKTGIPHFDNKARIEDTVRNLNFPSHVIIRPVFFMENLLSPWFLNGDKLHAALKPTTVLQMIAVSDIGQYGARAFTDAATLNRREIDIAGDAVTIPQAAATLSSAIGQRIEFVQVPIEEVRKNSADLALMLEWFDRVGYDADIPALTREFGIQPTPLAAWAAAHAASR